ncbi:hypothetical protein ZIOFF_013118 [Zingiber officinale]|uniref:Uncharacterized protein n=1 Tax=Zingiber officinale TaxID=94328 RepID=A0A8J5LKN5_ZINOF|nr:hypothetical protein ZIOFF_013118 [Zingiber officinale]
MLEETMRHGLSMRSWPLWVVIEAGMARLTAAHCLHTGSASDFFGLCVVKAGHHIGDRIPASEFTDDRIKMDATWIHGIDGSPIHSDAADIGTLAGSSSVLGSEWTGSPSSGCRSPRRRRRQKGSSRRG